MLSKLKKKNRISEFCLVHFLTGKKNAFLTSLTTFRWPVCVDATRLLSRKESQQPIKMKASSRINLRSTAHTKTWFDRFFDFKLFHSDLESLVKWKPRSLIPGWLGGDTVPEFKLPKGPVCALYLSLFVRQVPAELKTADNLTFHNEFELSLYISLETFYLHSFICLASTFYERPRLFSKPCGSCRT